MTFELTEDRGVQLISNEKIQNNLILKAAELIEEKLSQSLNCKITLNKKIPIGAGLGGGSSNAATTLLILNRLLNLNYSNDQLSKLGYHLGADVPIFLLGENKKLSNPPLDIQLCIFLHPTLVYKLSLIHI